MRYIDTQTKGVNKITQFGLLDIAEWYKGYGLPIPSSSLLSDMGFIADGRVAAWLYVTNSGIAMIENVIADPKSIPSLRRTSLDKLIGFLVDTAVSLGYTTIIGVTKHPQILKVGKKFGFTEMKDYKLVALVTGDE